MPTQINSLPVAELTGTTANATFPIQVDFEFSGPLLAQQGSFVWVNPFQSASLQGTIASLGPGSVPASQAVVINVMKGTGVHPSYTDIYSGATPTWPNVPVGQQVGAYLAPPSTVTLGRGDTLRVDLAQVGGGATPTDHDLIVVLFLLVSST